MRLHRRVYPVAWMRLAVVSAALLIGISVPAAGQERELYVSVLDGSGTPVTGLGVADFVVREDGVQREVLRVLPATRPMQIALLVDNSAALDGSLTELREALTRFVRALTPDHEIALVTVADRPTLAVDSTTSADALVKGIDRIFPQPGSGATLLDAIVEVSRGFEKREAPRPVIVAVTTEGPDFSNFQYQQVLDAIEEGGAAFHVIAMPPTSALDTDEARNRNVVLGRGPTESGGRRDQILSSMALPGTLATVAERLKNQYLVVYGRPDSLIPPERVEVDVRKPGLDARGTPARTGGPR